MKNEDLITLLKSKQEINYIGMAITPLHAAGIDASLLYLKSIGVEPHGYILVTAHPSTGKAIGRDNFSCNYPGIEFLNYEYAFSAKKNLIDQVCIKRKILNSPKADGESDIYFAWTETVSNIMYIISEAIPHKKLHLIKIDDGAGAYLSRTYLKFSLIRHDYRKLYKIPLAYLKALMYGMASRMNENAFRERDTYLDANIYHISKRNTVIEYIPNKDFICFYNKAFKAICKDTSDLYLFDGAIVINTQPLEEIGLTEGVVDYELYEQLSIILNKFDRNVVLKPHPREKNVEKYSNLGWPIYGRKGISQEVIFANVERKPICVISIYSSTLLNAYGLSGIPAISLAKIMLTKDITSALKKELQKYIKNYQNLIYFPMSFNELEKYLMSIIVNDP